MFYVALSLVEKTIKGSKIINLNFFTFSSDKVVQDDKNKGLTIILPILDFKMGNQINPSKSYQKIQK